MKYSTIWRVHCEAFLPVKSISSGPQDDKNIHHGDGSPWLYILKPLEHMFFHIHIGAKKIRASNIGVMVCENHRHACMHGSVDGYHEILSNRLYQHSWQGRNRICPTTILSKTS